MLLVETFIKESLVHGLGLYSKQLIPKGTVIWKYDSKTTKKYSFEQFKKLYHTLGKEALLSFLNYSYIKSKSIYYIQDNTRYINHSPNNNIAFKNENEEIATRDILPGDELLENYNDCYDHNDFFNYINDINNLDHKAIIDYLDNYPFKAKRLKLNYA